MPYDPDKTVPDPKVSHPYLRTESVFLSLRGWKELRKYIASLKTRHEDSDMRKLQSAKVLAALEAHPAFRAANTILLYHSLKDEVDTHTFIRKWSNEKRILLPVVVGDELELRIYSGPEDMATGSYGIEEPTGEILCSKNSQHWLLRLRSVWVL